MGLLLVLLGATCVAAACAPVLRWCLKLLNTKIFMWRSSVPGPPVENWLLGHVSVLLSDRAPFIMAAWANTYGRIYKLQMNDAPCVVLTDPAAIQQLIRSPSSPDYITKAPAIYRALEQATKPALHNIVSSADGPYWRAVRHGTAQCFSISNLKQAFPWVMTLCNKAVQHIGRQHVAARAAAAAAAAASAPAPASEIDAVDLCKRYTSDVIGSLLFNKDLRGMDMEKNDYVGIFSSVVEEVHKHMCNPFRFLMLWDADAARGRVVLERHDRLITEKVEEMKKVPPPDFTIAGHLLKVKDPATGQPLTSNQLKAEIAMFMAAGFETTSHAISWTLILLATHQDVQATLAAELAAAGLAPGPPHLMTSPLPAAAAPAPAPAPAASAAGPGCSVTSSIGSRTATGLVPDKGAETARSQVPRELQWSDLSSLPYLTAVMRESLRLLHPASLGTFRICHKETTVLGHVLPKGTMVIISPYIVGSSGHLFGESVEMFYPERWLDQQQQRLQELKLAAGLPTTFDSDLAATDNNHATGLTDPPSVKAAAAAEPPAPGSASVASVAASATAAGAGTGRFTTGDMQQQQQQLLTTDGLPFLVGPRDCIGQALAKVELQALIATLAGHFHIQPGQLLSDTLAAAGVGAAAAAAAPAERPGNPRGIAAAGSSRAAAVKVLKDNGIYHVTLQPQDGLALLKMTPRYCYHTEEHGIQLP